MLPGFGGEIGEIAVMTKIDLIAVVCMAVMTVGVTWWQMYSDTEDMIASETCGLSMTTMQRFVFCEDGPQ